jgi:hypothetical protein
LTPINSLSFLPTRLDALITEPRALAIIHPKRKQLVALKEFAEERRRFIRDADDLVRCLTIEFEIELGPGSAVIPVGEMFELAPPQRPLRERGVRLMVSHRKFH